MSVTLDMSGLRRFQRGLVPALVEAVSETTVDVWADAVYEVAVDTGNLQENITIEGEGLVQNVGVDTDKVEYAVDQEFGMSAERKAEKGYRRYSHTPFISPSAERNRHKLPRNIRKRVRRIR